MTQRGMTQTETILLRVSVTGLALLAVYATGCASTAVAVARHPTATARIPVALTPAAAVALGDATAATAPAHVVFVDEKPAHCDGALCLTIVNNHRNPVLLTINGQVAQVVGPMGPLLPPQSSGYIRLVHPGRVEIAYKLYDSMRLEDNGVEMPLATVLAWCRVTAEVGGANDAYWGGHVTRLSSFFCDG